MKYRKRVKPRLLRQKLRSQPAAGRVSRKRRRPADQPGEKAAAIPEMPPPAPAPVSMPVIGSGVMSVPSPLLPPKTSGQAAAEPADKEWKLRFFRGAKDFYSPGGSQLDGSTRLPKFKSLTDDQAARLELLREMVPESLDENIKLDILRAILGGK